jgi:hypothetical protein
MRFGWVPCHSDNLPLGSSGECCIRGVGWRFFGIVVEMSILGIIGGRRVGRGVPALQHSKKAAALMR